MKIPLAAPLFALTFAAMLPSPLSAADHDSPAAKIGSSVWDWEKLEVKPTSVGERRDVAKAPTATLLEFESHISTLNPGQPSHPPHQHPQEEIILLRTGTLQVHINGTEQVVGPGSMFFFASYDWHAVRNVGQTPATYFVFNFTTAETKTLEAKPTAEVATPAQLHSSVFNWEKLAVKPTPKGERRDVVDSATRTCTRFESHVTTLRGGEEAHAAHRHPDEELIIVKDGFVEVTVAGKTNRGGPGTIFFFASNDLHGLKNVGTENATYYVIRVVTSATPKA